MGSPPPAHQPAAPSPAWPASVSDAMQGRYYITISLQGEALSCKQCGAVVPLWAREQHDDFHRELIILQGR